MTRQEIMTESLIFTIVFFIVCSILVYLDMKYNKSRFNKTIDKRLNCSLIKRNKKY